MKPPILLLHGALGASVQMKNIAAVLSSDFTVHVFDLPGHGGAQMPDEPFSIQLFSEAVHSFILENKLERCTVFGYSMGGYIAMYLAKHFPGIFIRMITLGTKFHWDEMTAMKEKKMMDPGIIALKIPAFASSLERMHAPNDWKLLLTRSAAMLEEMGKDNPLKLTDYLAIDTPALIMLGDRDKMVSMEETLDIYKALPAAELAVLPATGHPIEQVDPLLLKFLIAKC